MTGRCYDNWVDLAQGLGAEIYTRLVTRPTMRSIYRKWYSLPCALGLQLFLLPN